MNDSAPASIPGFDPADLDGHTMDELIDYLDAGRTPVDPSIEGSPGCRIALDALTRLRDLGPALLDEDVQAEPPADEGWVRQIMTNIALDARAGRRIPVVVAEPDDVAMTEGAVRGLVRAAEAEVPGVLIGRCRLDGDVTTPGAPIRVEVEASVPYGEPIAALATRLRAAVAATLERHTELVVTAIDVVVHDVRLLAAETAAETGEGKEEGR